MTIDISDNNPRISYTANANGAQTAFAVPFEFFDNGDLNVYIAGVAKSEGTGSANYGVSGGSGSTGTVTFVSGVTASATVVITRGITIERTTDFTAGADINRASLNTQLDLITGISADLEDKSDRTLHLADSDSAVSTTLPLLATRKGTVLGFNASTGAVEAGPNITTVQSLADVATAINLLGTSSNTNNVNTVASSISNVNTVASSISGVNDFAARYRIGSSNPSSNNDAGDIFFNTETETLKIYTGSAWETGITSGNTSYGDNQRIILGDGNDLQIYSDGDASHIDESGAGNLIIKATSIQLVDANTDVTDVMAAFTADGSAAFSFNGVVRATTTNSGFWVNGNLTLTGTVDGIDIATRDATLTSTTTTAGAALPKAGGAMTGAITTNSTFDGVDIAARDATLTSTTTTATAALPKAGGAMTGAITTNSTFDGRNVATDGTKLDYITVTQAVNLDQMETDIAALANGMVYKGNWDVSSGSFPGGGSAQTGWLYYVSVAGTVNSISFAVGDNIVATTDDASASIYANNWSKHDQTDVVQAVVGLTGSITKSGLLTALSVEDGADVTDTANVTAAGALMDSEVDADIKTLSLPANTTISAFGKTLVDDADVATARTTLGLGTAATTAATAYATAAQGTTADAALPKAGGAMTGNIDLAGNSITTTASNLDIKLDPNGTGFVVADASKFVIQDTDDSAVGPWLDFKHVTTSPAADYVSIISTTTTDSGGTEYNPHIIYSKVTDTTAGQLESTMEFNLQQGDASASTTPFFILDGENDKVKSWRDFEVAGGITATGGITIANAGQIGSVGDTDAIAIASDGVVTFSQIPVLPANSIDSDYYVNGSIDTAHIADANVTQGKIADQAINEAKMQISNGPTNGYFLSAQSGNTGGLTWAAAGGGASDYTINGKTSAYTVVSGDLGEIINVTANDVTITLPTASSIDGFYFWVKNSSDTSGHQVTIDGNGSETIDGLATRILERGEDMHLVSDGTNWMTLRGGSRAVANNIDEDSTAPVASGDGAVAIGASTQALGQDGLAMNGITGTQSYSTAIGYNSGGGAATTTAGAGAMSLGGSYASGVDSFAAAGASITSTYGAKNLGSVAIGNTSKSAGDYSVAIGYQARTASHSAVSIGREAGSAASGTSSVSIGHEVQTGGSAVAIGKSTIANGYASVALGNYARTNGIQGKFAYACDYIGSGGDAQTGIYVLHVSTTDATATAITTTGTSASSTNQIIVQNSAAYSFHGTIVAREKASEGTDTGAWEVKGIIRREANAGTTSLLASTVTDLIVPTNWAVALSADTTNGCLKIACTGVASTNIRWVGTIHTSELIYA